LAVRGGIGRGGRSLPEVPLGGGVEDVSTPKMPWGCAAPEGGGTEVVQSLARQLQLPVLHSRRGDDSGALSGDGGVATQTQNSGDRRWWQAMTAADKHAGRDGQTRRKLRYLEDSFEGPLLCGLGSKFCEPT
jgi:hypothetical protein